MGDDTTAANAVTSGTLRSPQMAGARRALASAVLAVAFSVGCWSVAAGRASASSETVDECVRRKVAAGETRSVALAACLAASNNSTVAPSGTPSLSSSSSDDGTSPVLLVAVGLGGALIGAGVATVLRGRRGTAGAPAAPAPGASPTELPAMAPPPPGGLTAPAPPPMAPPAAGAAATNGASAVLMNALIDLSDRVPSQALRAEILAALGRAGVHPVEPAVGDAFDVTRMRGVGGIAAPDAGWSGRVASVERAGFHDGVSMVRLPEVVVYTAGS